MPWAKVVKPLFKNPDRSPNGMGTVFKEDIKGKFGMPDPTQWSVIFDDFYGKTSGNLDTLGLWISTVTGTGTAVYAAQEGGIVTITNSAANNDATTISKNAGYTWATNRGLVFEAKLEVDDATNAHFAVGMVLAAGTAASYTDGITIRKAAAGTSFVLEAKKNGATTYSVTLASGGSNLVCPAATQITLGFAYKGATQVIGGVTYYELLWQVDLNDGNGPRQGSLLVPSTSVTTAALSPTVSVVNGTAAARTVKVDYVFAAKERFY